jgi:DNA-binding XRE family transcriptional regulator
MAIRGTVTEQLVISRHHPDDTSSVLGISLASLDDFMRVLVDKSDDGDDIAMNPPLLHLNRPVTVLMVRARHAMGFTQQRLGDALGSSKRTAHRWESGRASPSVSNVRTLAAMVFPHDPGLASELAAAASTNLIELGLVRPPEPPPLPSPAPPPPPTRLVVQAVVCVAADELAVAPETVRRALYAAFKCARELRLSIEDVEKALEPDVPRKPATARASRAPSADR